MSASTRFLNAAIIVATAFALALAAPLPATAASVPAVPSGIKVAVTSSSATLTWNKATGATSYRVCLRTSKTASSCLRVSPRSSATTVTFTALKPTAGTDYYARVSAYNAAGYSRSPSFGFNLAPQPAVPGPATGITNVPTSSGVTVTWNAAKNATSYRVCLLPSYTATTCLRSSPASAVRKAVFTGLLPTPGADYFTRVSSYNGTRITRSALIRFDLPVGAITGFAVTAHDTKSIDFAWNAATNADSYQLQLATNSTFTTIVKNAKTSATTYTASALVPGTTYYARVRGFNSDVGGGFVKTSVRLPTDPFTAVVVTYNLCGQNKCVTSANGMKRWTTRKPLAGAIARGTGADIFATQESQITDTNFGTELPGFTLCRYYSAKSLFVKTTKYSVLRSGMITLDSTTRRYAVWCELRDKVTRSRFIVSDAHLEPFKGKTRDDLRYLQTRRLLHYMALANPQLLPVVYAGDFNSNKSNADQDKYPGGYDAPMKAFTAAGTPDSFVTADVFTNPSWNSSNQAKNPPTRHYDHIDHIFIDKRIHAKGWKSIISIITSGTVKLYATPFASDHNPVRAVLIIPGRS